MEFPIIDIYIYNSLIVRRDIGVSRLIAINFFSLLRDSIDRVRDVIRAFANSRCYLQTR